MAKVTFVISLFLLLVLSLIVADLKFRCSDLQRQVDGLRAAGVLQAEGSLILCEEIRKLKMAEKTAGRL